MALSKRQKPWFLTDYQMKLFLLVCISVDTIQMQNSLSILKLYDSQLLKG